MKMVPVRFFYVRARIFGWIIALCIVAYAVSSIYSKFVN
jgi:hypothetical protein